MSYEIRTPITTVVGFAELFVEEHDLADEDVFISEIKTNATYLLKLVNDILFLSRLDARMIEFKKEPVEFATTFEGHCQMGWAVQRKPGVDYRVVNPYDRLVVEIDDGYVGYVIEKIVESAARHTGSGLVCCRFDYIGDRLLITVDDSGEGFSASAQETMFERFGATSGNGTDLSLPICLELVHQMNGAINVNSAPGRGTTIWIEIPCKATIVEKRKTAIEA
jgi:signal transduction histidine kinase